MISNLCILHKSLYLKRVWEEKQTELHTKKIWWTGLFMIQLIHLHTNKEKLQKVKLHNSMSLKDLMITHWFLNQDLKVVILEELFKFMNMSMILFLNLITILEATPNGITLEFQIPKLVKTIDLISLILSSLILFTIMEWDL